MEERKIAIQVKNVEKVYKLYDRLRDRMYDALGIGRQKYKLHYALKGVSLNIYRGETVGIIGTNGSGKSTILKIITGVLNPSAGEVMVDGRISALLELGAGFNQEYNGIENIYLNGTMMGFSEKEIKEKLPAILEFADIGDYVYQPVKTYSSGMFVRLAFAVAINIEPEILIVDEALSVGDVFFQAKCYHKFEEFKEMGKTIVFVSHDLNSISKYCDRVFLLNKGNLLGEGSPKEMIDAYKRVLVGQYVEPADQMQAEDGAGIDAVGNEASGSGSKMSGNGTSGSGSKMSGNGTSGSGNESCRDQNGTGNAQNLKAAQGYNANIQEYGNMQAQIVEYYITDESGLKTLAILKGGEYTLHMRVKVNDFIPAPIFCFSLKNVQGTEITGTNSMIERAFLEHVDAGDEKEITFTQRMTLQGGEYLVSLGVTGYRKDTFEVYHRLYDVLNITCVSDKNTVGFYDMESTVLVKNSSGQA